MIDLLEVLEMYQKVTGKELVLYTDIEKKSYQLYDKDDKEMDNVLFERHDLSVLLEDVKDYVDEVMEDDNNSDSFEFERFLLQQSADIRYVSYGLYSFDKLKVFQKRNVFGNLVEFAMYRDYRKDYSDKFFVRVLSDNGDYDDVFGVDQIFYNPLRIPDSKEEAEFLFKLFRIL